MKIFLDTANIDAIKQWHRTGLIDGVTTNPTHLAKEGGDPVKQVLEICKIVHDGEISVEVTEVEPQKVYEQAKKIRALADNIVVKVPCYHTYYDVIHKLVQEGVPLNITLVFSLIQGLLMCKLGVLYISPFVGRWDDIDADGMVILSELRAMVDQYGYQTAILAASMRGVRHIHDAILSGADIVTVPVDVLEKMTKHVLTDRGMETFNNDWKKLGISQFP